MSGSGDQRENCQPNDIKRTTLVPGLRSQLGPCELYAVLEASILFSSQIDV
jgi:hypothetical protein